MSTNNHLQHKHEDRQYFLFRLPALLFSAGLKTIKTNPDSTTPAAHTGPHTHTHAIPEENNAGSDAAREHSGRYDGGYFQGV